MDGNLGIWEYSDFFELRHPKKKKKKNNNNNNNY